MSSLTPPHPPPPPPLYVRSERDNFASLLSDGWLDVWRDAHPMVKQYSASHGVEGGKGRVV